jgi:C4-dicarboxylate-specific signal transduction histidine kinase
VPRVTGSSWGKLTGSNWGKLFRAVFDANALKTFRRGASWVQMELAADLPPVTGDRVQLQQVVLNLVLNGIEAMSTVADYPRELVIRTQRSENDDEVRVDPQQATLPLRSS